MTKWSGPSEHNKVITECNESMNSWAVIVTIWWGVILTIDHLLSNHRHVYQQHSCSLIWRQVHMQGVESCMWRHVLWWDWCTTNHHYYCQARHPSCSCLHLTFLYQWSVNVSETVTNCFRYHPTSFTSMGPIQYNGLIPQCVSSICLLCYFRPVVMTVYSHQLYHSITVNKINNY